MSVLSCMAMNQPNVMIGTAPEASYWLLRSEDEYSENLVEQDYWAAAIEFADSVGVDLVNTSLGYYSFDDPTKNYRYRDLNGHYALMSREAAKAADKGNRCSMQCGKLRVRFVEEDYASGRCGECDNRRCGEQIWSSGSVLFCWEYGRRTGEAGCCCRRSGLRM